MPRSDDAQVPGPGQLLPGRLLSETGAFNVSLLWKEIMSTWCEKSEFDSVPQVKLAVF